MPRHPHSSRLLALVIALSATSTSLAATPATWIGTTGLWTTPGNWSTNIAPLGFTYDVLIPNGTSIIDATGPGGANALSVAFGASLFVSASSTGNAALVTLSTFSNAGTFTLDAGAQTSPSGFTSTLTLITGSSLLNTGTVNFSNPYNGLTQPFITGSAITNSGTLNFTVTGSIAPPVNNFGLVTITPGTLSSPHIAKFNGAFTQSAGTLDLSAPFTSATFSNLTYNGGTILGTPAIYGALAVNSTAPASFLMNSQSSGNTQLSGALAAGQSLEISSTPNGTETANITTSLFTNAGTITLDAGTQSGPAGFISSLSANTLINTGTINLSNPYNVNQTFISGTALTNSGALTFNVTGQVTIPVNNFGLVTVTPGTPASPHTATFNNTFTQSAGTLDLSAPNAGAIFSTLNLNGGTVLGKAVISGTLNINAAVPGTFQFITNGTNSLNGTIRSGQTVEILATSNSTATVSVSTASNAGTILLDANSNNAGPSVMFINGTLINSGTISLLNPNNYRTQSSLAGAGNSFFGFNTVPITNSGTLSIGVNTAFNTNAITNTGLVTVAAGASPANPIYVNFNTFNQNAGTLDVSAPNTVIQFSALTINGGAIVGTPSIAGSLTLSSAASVPATFLFNSNTIGNLSGNIAAGQTIHITSGPGFNITVNASNSSINAGAILMDSPLSASTTPTLTFNTLSNTGTITLAFYNSPFTNFGGLQSFSSFSNSGTFNINTSTSLPGTITNTGLTTISAGPSVALPHNVSFTTFSQNAGTLDLSAPNVNASFSDLQVKGGTILGTVHFTVVSELELLGGNTGTFYFDHTSQGASLAGSVAPNQTVHITATSIPSLVTTVLGSITNAGTFIFDTTATGSGGYSHLSTNTFTNSGTLTFANPFNSPTSPFSGNQFLPNLSTLTNSGTINFQANAYFPASTFINTGLIVLTAGPGTGQSPQNSFFIISLTQNAGTLDFSAPNSSANFNSLTVNGGTLLGTAFIGASLTLAGGTTGTFRFTGPATLQGNIAAGQTVRLLPQALSISITTTGGLANAGTLTFEDQPASPFATTQFNLTGPFTNSGTVLIANTRNFNSPSPFQGIPFFNGATTINNSGIFNLQASAYFSMPFNNSGNITVSAGISGTPHQLQFGTLNQSAGTIDASAPFTALGAVNLNYTGGQILGQINVVNLTISPTAGAGSFLMQSGTSPTLTGDLAANQSLDLNPVPSGPASVIVQLPSSFTNRGTIHFNAPTPLGFGSSFSYSQLNFTPSTTFTNFGSLLLANPFNAQFLSFPNTQPFFNAASTTNHGTITATANWVYSGALTNSADGTISIQNAQTAFSGPVTNSGVIITDPSSLTFNSDLLITPTGYLKASLGDIYLFHANFLNHSTQGALWDTSAAALEFALGPGNAHTLDLTGIDGGTFQWKSLTLDTNQTLTLLGGPGDDLYVDQLILPNGLAQLAALSSSGPSIFYNASNPFNFYLNNLTVPLGNGAFLTPAPIPEPATLSLLLPLATLPLLQRRRKPPA